MGSSRLAGKVLKPILGKPLILHQINRIMKSVYLNEMVVAIPNDHSNDVLAEAIENHGIKLYRGDSENVLNRFDKVIKNSNAEVIIRSTADCPLFMPEMLDQMLLNFEELSVDYLSNSLETTFPDGLDIEIFTKNAFEKLTKLELSAKEKEHVTLGFYDGKFDFKIQNFSTGLELGDQRWTVDYPEDFEFVKEIYENVGAFATLEEVLYFLKENPSKKNSRSSTFRNIALKGELSEK